MISIEKLMQQLSQCKDTSIILPVLSTSYVQNTAIDIRKEELENLNTNFKFLNEANYTMDNELEKLNNVSECSFDSINNTNTNNTHGQNGNGNANSNIHNRPQTNINNNNNGKDKRFTQEVIPNKSLIVYSENETATLPEIILTLLNNFKEFDEKDWYIYGIKNPESFYKSFLLLSKLDFIIKNKNEKKNEVVTFKREMAIQYETFYKTLNYRKLKFPRNDMVNNLTNTNNYTEYDLFQFIADYNKINFIILDIINDKFLDIVYTDNSLISKSDENKNKFVVIIKYSANTYLPLMKSSGDHTFSYNILNIIAKNFERIVINKYKEPRNIKDSNDDKDDEDNEETVNNIESNALIYSIEDALNLDSINIDSIISSCNIIENTDEIDTNKQEDLIVKVIKDIKNTNENDITQEKNQITKNEITPIDNLDSKVPMINNNINNTKLNKSVKKTKPVVEKVVKEKVAKEKVSDQEDELKPIAKYTLLDLQMLARLHKIDTQKMGSSDKKINKLKAELYEDIKNKM